MKPARRAATWCSWFPGFMAGDASLTALAGWLRRRGHQVRGSGVDQRRLRRPRARSSRGETGRVGGTGDRRRPEPGGAAGTRLAAGNPDRVAALVTLGSPVLDPLAVSPSVMRTVRSVARLGDLGMPGVFSSDCMDGACCADFTSVLEPRSIRACRRSQCTPAATGSWNGEPASTRMRVRRIDGSHSAWPSTPRFTRSWSPADATEVTRAVDERQDAMFLHVENDVTPCTSAGSASSRDRHRRSTS